MWGQPGRLPARRHCEFAPDLHNTRPECLHCDTVRAVPSHGESTMKIRLLMSLAALLVLNACSLFQKGPGMSVVRFYNNSGHGILVEDNELRPQREGTFTYPADSDRALIVFWSGCVHTYIAPKRKPGEFRSTDWMLRGAYRVQLEGDGRLYLLPPYVAAPADVASLRQPAGFPLEPREGSSCLP